MQKHPDKDYVREENDLFDLGFHRVLNDQKVQQQKQETG